MRRDVNLAAFAALTSLTSVLAVENNDAPTDPSDDSCGYIIDTITAGGSPWFWASDVYECLTSVPFNSAVALRFLKYYRETVQFHSNLDLLKSPPSSYKQPPVDFMQGLAELQAKVEAGVYQNQYAFEHELQSLVLKVHDTHFALFAGVLNQFTFGSNYEIIALSEDGRKAPEVYVYGDTLSECIAQPDCTPSAVDTMNGVPVVDYLTSFAANQSFGLLEPHADWNQLMISSALNIKGGMTTFGGSAALYPGDELNIILKNGSDTYDNYFVSLYNSPGYTGPLTTGGDFYNFFVLGIEPASYNATDYLARLAEQESRSDNSTSTDEADHWDDIAYPNNTLVHQEDLGTDGFVTGYLLEDISTAVLSIPSFNSDVGSFSTVLQDFVNNATDADVKKVIIDLQQNDGGQTAIALEAYRWFFPGVIPFTGSNMRAHSAADAIGQSFTSYFDALDSDDDYYSDFVSSEWAVTDRINAQTGRNFSSWAEYFGPRRLNESLFTLTQQYNLSSEAFNGYNLGIDFPSDVFNTSTPKQEFPWRAEDIIILTDGICSSACSLFVDMMTKQRGVRTVVVGGRPEPGPMQAVGGSRGTAAYSSDELDMDIDTAVVLNDTTTALLPPRANLTDTGMVVYHVGINLRNQIEANATLPNQFRYIPADCRIYWTFANYANYTRLWHDVHTAAYTDPTLCVPGSTNATASPIQKRSDNPPPSDSDKPVALSSYILSGLTLEDIPLTAGVPADKGLTAANFPILCSKNNKPDPSICPYATICREITGPCKTCTTNARFGGQTCTTPTTPHKEFRCLKSCTTDFQSASGICGNLLTCAGGKQVDSKVNASSSSKNRVAARKGVTKRGYCEPVWDETLTCKDQDRLWERYTTSGASGRSIVPAGQVRQPAAS